MPIIITATDPYQGIGDSCLFSGDSPTLPPHLGHSLDEAGNRILQAEQ
ncbi:hypothetical protein ES703_47254 [subsurface metagenome]